jgi:opacity protein-like surface antigen
MKRTLLAAAALVAFAGLAAAASAVTLSVTPNAPTYTVGQTVTLNVVGDSQGSGDNAILGRLAYDLTLTSTVTSAQTTHTSPILGAWTANSLLTGDGFAEVFDQTSPLGLTLTVQQIQNASVTLVADLPGTVIVTWSSLDFFGLTSQAGTSFTIVPEPMTAALSGLGLLGLALAGRRRA